MSKVKLSPAVLALGRYTKEPEPCHSGSDGEGCAATNDKRCPQLRDGEPGKSGRHCPLDIAFKEYWKDEL